MQQLGATVVMDRAERKRLEAVVETLAATGNRGETVAEVAHDARNMVTALGLYCDLLEEPGVLANPFAHYGSELRLVANASRRLVEKLLAIDTDLETSRNAAKGVKYGIASGIEHRNTGPRQSGVAGNRWPSYRDSKPTAPIGSLAVELLANHNLLAALAGPAVTLTMDIDGGARAVWMTGEDLTRVLVNLVKNASEAMAGGGRVQIGLHELPAGAGATDALALVVEDNGPGISEEAVEKVFESGYSTGKKGTAAAGSWSAPHRGLGLAITRSIVEAAGGRILAANRPQGGARFEIELPVRKTGHRR